MTKFITIASGKGGVGKTTVAINLGQALINLGKKVIVVDSNLVTPNISIHLGLINPDGTINKFLRKEKTIKDIIYTHESGLSIIPASPSYIEFQKTNPQKIAEIFEHLDNLADIVILDAPSGLGYEIEQILKHSDEVIIVANPNLSSVMDALKTIQLARSNQNIIAGIVLNMSHRGWHEMKPHEMEHILNYPIIANIKADRKIRKSLHQQLPLNFLYPSSRSAKEFQKVAEHITFKK